LFCVPFSGDLPSSFCCCCFFKLFWPAQLVQIPIPNLSHCSENILNKPGRLLSRLGNISLFCVMSWRQLPFSWPTVGQLIVTKIQIN
jgi:hypothetical protein